MQQPLITISIVSHGDVTKIKALFQSLFCEDAKDEYQYIITDNLGNEDYGDDIFTDAILIHNKTPKGFAENHNAAFHHTRGKYFCVLNPDILFIEPVFKRLIGYLEEGRADILAPLFVDSDGVVQDSFRDLPTPRDIIARRLFKSSPVQRPLKPLSPDWLAGMFLLMHSQTFRTLNGFDESYRFYFEDVEFSTRARLAGFRLLLEPGVCAQHDAHRGSRQSLRYLSWHIRSAIHFFTSETYRKAKNSRKR